MVDATIFIIAEPCTPVPDIKVIAELGQITFDTAGELVVMGCNLVGTQPRFQSSVTHAGCELRSGRHSTYVRPRNLRIHSSLGGVIRHCEWIERILNRHANARGTYPKGMICIREHVWRKSSRRQGAVEETAHVFEITKKLQVLAANFGVERAVEVFTVHRGHCRCESVEVKEPFVQRKTGERHVLRVVR